MYRIAITGTESTGKTTLVQQLAQHYNTVFVPDISRAHIERLKGKYKREDVLDIAADIIKTEDEMLAKANGVLFSDNCLVNIKIWLKYYEWEVPQWLNDAIEKRKNDLYLVCNIDIPWERDEQRKNPHDRAELLFMFTDNLHDMVANYKFVSGTGNERLLSAIKQVDRLLA
jgi:nicotinamide riboside kinase